MSFIWPLADHYITRDFYYRSSIYIGGMHAGIDLVRRYGDTTGRPIKAVASGKVRGVGWDIYSGFFVAVDHADGWATRYRHLYGQSPVVAGQRVIQGETIGNVGSTGWSTGPHLHFDLWHLRKQDPTAFSKSGWWAHNPELYLGKEDNMDEARAREIAREEADAALGRFVASRDEGTLARVLGIPAKYQDLVWALSRAAVAGAPDFQPSAVQEAISDAVKAHEERHGSDGDETHNHGIPAGRTGKS